MPQTFVHFIRFLAMMTMLLLQLPVSVATNVAKCCATIRLICGQPAERDPTHLPTLSAGQNNPLLGPVYVYEDVDVVGQHVADPKPMDSTSSWLRERLRFGPWPKERLGLAFVFLCQTMLLLCPITQ